MSEYRFPWGVQTDEALNERLLAYQRTHGLTKSQTLRLLLTLAFDLAPTADDSWMLGYKEGLIAGRDEGARQFFNQGV